jgi:hypothetical protein
MRHEYLQYVENDRQLYELIAPVLPGLRALSVEQVETLVFFLKSQHSYYPLSENHTAHLDTFSERLRELRESDKQRALQRKAASQLFKAMTTSAIAGALFALGAGVLFASVGWGLALMGGAVGLFVLAESRFGRPALEAAKEQDRRYFLASLRAARACNELDWSGLFAYDEVTQLGPQSDAALEQTKSRIAELTSQLRNALYNDEYMQYSTERPGAQ